MSDFVEGVTLADLLSARRPSFREVAELHDEPRPPRRLNDRVPRDLETVCLKAMAKEPTRRYPSAGEFAADLRRWLAGEPILARPTGPVERGRLWCQRHPAAWGLGALVLTAAVTAPTLFALAEANHARALGDEQGKTLRALGQSRESERKALRQAADSTLNRGLKLCEQGDVPLGLLWAARGLTLARDAGGPTTWKTRPAGTSAPGRASCTRSPSSCPTPGRGLPQSPFVPTGNSWRPSR